MKRILLLMVVVTTIFTSCKKKDKNAIDCSGAEKSFAADVSPIILTSCATGSSCHSAGSHQGCGALTTYTEISSNKNAIKSSVVGATMPKGATLSSTQKSAISCWIDAGAKNN